MHLIKPPVQAYKCVAYYNWLILNDYPNDLHDFNVAKVLDRSANIYNCIA